MEDMIYTNYELHLKPGDKIFVYTDGVTEATDKNDELFDDITMLCLEYKHGK